MNVSLTNIGPSQMSVTWSSVNRAACSITYLTTVSFLSRCGMSFEPIFLASRWQQSIALTLVSAVLMWCVIMCLTSSLYRVKGHCIILRYHHSLAAATRLLFINGTVSNVVITARHTRDVFVDSCPVRFIHDHSAKKCKSSPYSRIA